MLKSNLFLLVITVFCILVLIFYPGFHNTNSVKEMKSIKNELTSKPNSVNIPEVYKNRRIRLMEKIKDGILIISASKATEENFHYLTGFDEGNAICILMPGTPKPFHMFVLADEPFARLWTGKRHGMKGTMDEFGADHAYNIDDAAKILEEMISDKSKIYLDPTDFTVKDLLDEINKKKIKFENPRPIIDEMRVIKDEYEIEQLRQACNVSCDAYIRALKNTQPHLIEHEIQAEVEYVFTKNGMQLGYPSIIGSGPNAAILHYEKNNREMKSGELLLMDVGAACNHYSADLTRTIPVSGKFSKEQKLLYELILEAQNAAIKDMIPGKKILDCHHTATRIIVNGLARLGLITDTSKYWQKRFYIQYRNDHYIGLNVHDAGSYGDFNAAARDDYIINPRIRGRMLEPGMVLTMEPGLYFAAERIDQIKEIFPDLNRKEIDSFVTSVKPVYQRYADIGIRIEDDILITKDGNEVLTARAPRSVQDIEKLMK
jgi:Xaa-Pro aminopeptidase